MSKPKFTFGILVSLLSLCLDVSIQAQPKETKPETATVSGLVALKGEPARGVTVMLLGQYSNTANSPRARSDENGRFRITGVAAGRYSITALAPGYVSMGDGNMGRMGQMLNVAEGEKIENINIDIKRGGVIAGSVTDSRGRPVVEEVVNLDLLDKNGKPQGNRYYTPNREMYLTDDRGAYRIFGLPEGHYLVSVGQEQRPGSVGITSNRVFYPRAYHPGVSDESKAKVIEVNEGSEATDVDITLPEAQRTCEISGRVVDADTGQPVAEIEVIVGSLSPDGRPTGGWAGNGARSTANGEFRLTGAFPGKYALLVRPEVRYSPTGRPEVSTGEGFISEPIILNIEDDVQGVEIKVRRGASISGQVVIEGTNDPKILSKLSQVSFYVYVTTGSPNRQTVPGGGANRVFSDGKFQIRGLPAGKAFISLMRPQDIEGLVLARIEHNGATMREGIDLEAGQQLSGVRVVLAHGALKLRGELKLVGGAAPDGVRFYVDARRLDSLMQGSSIAEVDARGQFVLENVLPGEYEVIVSPVYTPNSERLDPQTMLLISTFRERVVVSGANQQPIVLVIDLSRKEGNR